MLSAPPNIAFEDFILSDLKFHKCQTLNKAKMETKLDDKYAPGVCQAIEEDQTMNFDHPELFKFVK